MEKTYKTLKLLIWILAFAVVIVGAYVLYNRLSSEISVGGIATVAQETKAPEATENPGETAAETEAKGSEAPDFTVYDLEGNAYKLSDFRGKPVLLNFWASWCGPCQMEMPDFQKFYETHGDKVNFVIVNLTDGQQETVESASAFIAEKGYTFPVYYDTDIDAAMKYGVSAVPVSYFIDAEGRFVAWAQGAMDADMLQQGMDMLLG
jgi:thiol-disulfide isomerase/thioredoxin